jgi:hypothetical protein
MTTPTQLPVICDRCGTVFSSGNAFALGDGTVHFQQVGVGPCPTCGSMGSIPDGTYESLGGTASFILSHTASPDHLRILQRVLTEGTRCRRNPRRNRASCRRRAPRPEPRQRNPEAVGVAFSAVLACLADHLGGVLADGDSALRCDAPGPCHQPSRDAADDPRGRARGGSTAAGREAGAQRSLPVRIGKEVQALPRSVARLVAALRCTTSVEPLDLDSRRRRPIHELAAACPGCGRLSPARERSTGVALSQVS